MSLGPADSAHATTSSDEPPQLTFLRVADGEGSRHRSPLDMHCDFLKKKLVILILAFVVFGACVVAAAFADSDWIRLEYSGVETKIGWRRMKVAGGNAVGVKCTNPDDASKCETVGYVAVGLVSASAVLSIAVAISILRGQDTVALAAAILATVAIWVSWSLYYSMTVYYKLDALGRTDFSPGFITDILIGASVIALPMTRGLYLRVFPPRGNSGSPYSGVPQ